MRVSVLEEAPLTIDLCVCVCVGVHALMVWFPGEVRTSIRRKWMCRPMRASQRRISNQVLVQPSPRPPKFSSSAEV